MVENIYDSRPQESESEAGGSSFPGHSRLACLKGVCQQASTTRLVWALCTSEASLGAQLRVFPSNEVEQWGNHVSRHRASSSSRCLWEAGLGGLDPERVLSLPQTPQPGNWLSLPILLELLSRVKVYAGYGGGGHRNTEPPPPYSAPMRMATPRLLLLDNGSHVSEVQSIIKLCGSTSPLH